MKNMEKRIFAVIICITVFASLFSNVLAADDDSLSILLEVGKDTAFINGLAVATVAPFIRENTVFVQAKTVFEAFGAELVWKGDGNIKLVYRDVDIDFTLGKTEYTVNQETMQLDQAPVASGGSTMVPLRFIEENFDVVVSFDEPAGIISIVMEDDGALTDFSFLTNSIGKPKAGNSFFGWSMSIPSGSRLSNSSFNSKYTYIINEHRAIGIEVWVRPDQGQTLQEYYGELTANPGDYFNLLVDSSLNTDASTPYAEFLYINLMDESVMERVYINQNRIYSVTLTSYNEMDPNKIKEDRYLKDMMNSFSFGYDGSAQDVQDVSKITFGLAKYENYVRFDYTNKYFNWEMNVLPDWEILNTGDDYPMHTRLGPDTQEYIGVYVSKSEGAEDIQVYGESVAEWNEKYLNPDCYKLVENGLTELSGYKAYRLVFELIMGGSRYIVDDYYVLYGSFVYNVTVKAPADRYESQQEIYDNMLSTFKINTINEADLEKDIDNYNIKYGNQRIGKDDSATDYQNKTFSWSMKLPGYWEKHVYSDESFNLFMHPETSVQIGVEAVELNEYNRSAEPVERFSMVDMLEYQYEMKETEKKVIDAKETSVTFYRFRLDDAEKEIFADVEYYFFETDKNAYCFMTYVPDLFSSEAIHMELDEIWDSFTVIAE